MSHIRLVTPIPGPRSAEILARRAAATPAGLAKATEIAVDHAEGALVHDVDGNTLIDLAGGIGMLNVGHSPPAVVAAVRDQVGRYVHPCALIASYEPYVAVAERLNALTPGDFPKKTLLSNSGAEAVENAVKAARAFTGRAGVICFEGGYHGRTLLTLSLTSKYGLFKKGFGPFAPEIYRLPAPNVYRRPAGLSEEAYVAWCCEQLDHALVAQVDPSAVAAIIVEPILGEGGFIPLPVPFLARLREIATQHGIVMIADEVQSGFGRTGRMFAIEHSGVVPDVITMAKSLAAGMPLGATTGRADVMDAAHLGGVGGTFGGSPVACAAALATLDMVTQPGFLQRADHVGGLLRETLQGWQSESRLFGDVRGLGAMIVMELVADRGTRAPLAPEHTLRIVKGAVAGGVLLIRAGLYSNCVRFLPPLVIEDDQLHEGLGVVRASLAVVEAELAGR